MAVPQERHFTRTHPDARQIGDKPKSDLIDLSIYIDFSAPASELDNLATFLTTAGFTVNAVNPVRHHLELSATVLLLEQLFATSIAVFEDVSGDRFFAPSNEPILPTQFSSLIVALVGMDSSLQATPKFRIATAATISYAPPEIAKAYRFPVLPAAGRRIALIELGGGFHSADITAYFNQLNLPVPTVTAISVDGGSNAPSTPTSSDAEVMLDIEVAGSAAPGTAIDVYFAPNTNRGFIDAVSVAATSLPRPDAISISWGAPEQEWAPADRNLLANIVQTAATGGTTVTVAAGDNGSSDGLSDGLAHVDFPASAPYALACGGTRIQLTPAGDLAAQTVWNDLANGGGATGGGISRVFPLPAYQAGARVPPSVDPGHPAGRGLPDVAANADPQTGYQIRVDGTEMVVGGTSAVAPLMAALIALLNQEAGTPQGFVHPAWYQTLESPPKPPPFFPIDTGSNGAYKAGPGWNACCGLGSPIGTNLKP